MRRLAIVRKPASTLWCGLILPGLLLLVGAPAQAQDQGAPADPFTLDRGLGDNRNPFEGGGTTEVNGTETGERQEAEDIASINPMARVESRIPNRVENRIRSRLDRYYDSSATTTSSFEAASELTRRSGRQERRRTRR